MTLTHSNATGERELAAEVVVAETPLGRVRGVIGREPVTGEAYLFEWGAVQPRAIHMVGVRQPLDVLWLVDGVVQAVETLSPWRGRATHPAATVVELPAGVASAVSSGDEIRVG